MTVTAVTSPSPFTPDDYVPGGASFRAGSNKAVAAAVDLRETGTTEVAGADDFFGKDGLSFADLIDVINPLQHLPVIGQIYRAATGDAIAPAAQVAGSGLYGGIAGLFIGAGSAFFEEATGGDVERTLAGLFGNAGASAAGDAVTLVEAAPAGTTNAPGIVSTGSTDAAAVKAALAEGENARAALPAQANAPMASAGMPQMSPQAFQALMTSIGAVPQQAAAPAAGQAAGADVAPGADNRAAALELHDMLQGRAHLQGLALPPVRR